MIATYYHNYFNLDGKIGSKKMKLIYMKFQSREKKLN